MKTSQVSTQISADLVHHDRYLTSRAGRGLNGECGYIAEVEPDGTVRLWDSIADSYVLPFSLSARQLAYIRSRARCTPDVMRSMRDCPQCMELVNIMKSARHGQ